MRIKKTEHFATFEQAKAFVKSANIKSKKEYLEKCREFRAQGVICLPATPSKIYVDQWVSWPDYLSKSKGSMSVTPRRGAKFLNYDEAKVLLYEYASNNGISFKKCADFTHFAKTPEFINDLSMQIPIASRQYYSHLGTWKGWEDFLSVHAFDTMTYSDMKQLFADNKIENMDQLLEFCASHPECNISPDIENTCITRGDWEGWENLFFSSIKNEIPELNKDNAIKSSDENGRRVIDDIIGILTRAVTEIRSLI